MPSTELQKLKNQLEIGVPIDIDRKALLKELKELESLPTLVKKSFSPSSGVCPSCGRPY